MKDLYERILKSPRRKAFFWSVFLVFAPVILIYGFFTLPHYSIYIAGILVFWIIYTLLLSEFEILDGRNQDDQ